jgi:hypothetical protein
VLFDPFSGEVIDPDDLERLEQAEANLSRYLSGFGVLYGVRRDLRGAIAAKRKLAGLPRPRFRTEIQQRVSECPRCGDRHAAVSDDVDDPELGPGAEPNPFHDEETAHRPE